MMSQCRHGRDDRAFLTTADSARGDEHTSVLAPVGAGLPLMSTCVPESLPLCGEIAISGGDAEEEGVVGFEGGGGCDGDGFVFGSGVHLCCVSR